MVYAYLRVSTNDQDLEKFKQSIENYCKYKNMDSPTYVEEKVSGRKVPLEKRKLYNLIQKKDVSDIICPELSRLGRSTTEILKVLDFARSNNITMHLLKEGMIWGHNPNPTTILVFEMLSSISQFEVGLLSDRVKEKLAYLKSKGVKLGRPEGTVPKNKFDPDMNELFMLAKKDLSNKEIADHFGICDKSLYRYLKNNDIVLPKPSYELKKKRKSKKRKSYIKTPRKSDVLAVDVL